MALLSHIWRFATFVTDNSRGPGNVVKMTIEDFNQINAMSIRSEGLPKPKRKKAPRTEPSPKDNLKHSSNDIESMKKRIRALKPKLDKLPKVNMEEHVKAHLDALKKIKG
jgi:polyhydroxyalkanoate synthesis regulator protein